MTQARQTFFDTGELDFHLHARPLTTGRRPLSLGSSDFYLAPAFDHGGSLTIPVAGQFDKSAGGFATSSGSPAQATHISQDWAAYAGSGGKEEEEEEQWRDRAERAFLVGVQVKKQAQGARAGRHGYSMAESLAELGRLADTAGLTVVGQTYQVLEEANPRTYVGSGKVQELSAAVAAAGAETVIFDDELTPGQLRNLERALGERVRLCDRTALILDIFSQRAATREGKLQVGCPFRDAAGPWLDLPWLDLLFPGWACSALVGCAPPWLHLL